MHQENSTARWLLAAWLALIVYASLYPFEPWRWPPSQDWRSVLALPWPRKIFPWDAQINVVGYMPLGMLLRTRGPRPGLFWPLLLSIALSYTMEVLQTFLPGRVPSASDLFFNSTGALAGAVLAWIADRVGLLERSHGWRESWFESDSAGGLALLTLWPMALLCPTPVPLGVGRWLPHLQEWLLDALEGTRWEDSSFLWFEPDAPVQRALPPGFEALAIALGLLGPVLLGLAVARRGWRRYLLVPMIGLGGVLSTALSTALNFGPQHAWAWLTPPALPGLSLGLMLGLLAVPLPRRACAALGLVVLPSLIALVTHAPADPFLSISLQAWDQGRFVNLYGMGQWLGWVWPFGALAWLLTSVARR
ncbi:MAG: VanZ family protein [Paucibacter sp.]|nr:VanZ family protein [Roseateles sp.]